MRNLYVAKNKSECFDALVMAKDKQDALTIVKDYAIDAGIEGEWDISPTDLSIAKTMVFSCDYLIQDPVFDKDGVIDVGDVEEYYKRNLLLSHAIKIPLNNDMTLLVLQETDGTILSKLVMGQGDNIEYTHVVSENIIEESEFYDFLTGNNASIDALMSFARQEAIFRFNNAKVKYTDADVDSFAEDLVSNSEEWIDGQKLHELNCEYIRENDLEPRLKNEGNNA